MPGRPPRRQGWAPLKNEEHLPAYNRHAYKQNGEGPRAEFIAWEIKIALRFAPLQAFEENLIAIKATKNCYGGFIGADDPDPSEEGRVG